MLEDATNVSALTLRLPWQSVYVVTPTQPECCAKEPKPADIASEASESSIPFSAGVNNDNPFTDLLLTNLK